MSDQASPVLVRRPRILDGFGGVDGLGVRSAEQDVRLRTTKSPVYDCPDGFFTAADDAVAGAIFQSYGPTELFLETKPSLAAQGPAVAQDGAPVEQACARRLGADGWPKTYGEFGAVGSNQHYRVFKLACYTPPTPEADERSQRDEEPTAGAEGSPQVGSMSDFCAVMFGYHVTLGDVRALFGHIRFPRGSRGRVLIYAGVTGAPSIRRPLRHPSRTRQAGQAAACRVGRNARDRR